MATPGGGTQGQFIEPWHVTQRSAHQNIWESVRSVPNQPAPGQATEVHRYIELATGLNALNELGEFVPAVPDFTIAQNGVEALGAAHTLRLAADIGTDGSVQVTAPDGTVMRSHPAAVAYYDPVDGRSAIIGMVVSGATGLLVSPQEVVYPDCFSGIKASLQYKNSRRGMSQNLLLERRPLPPTSYGLSAKSRLELLTEVLGEAPQTVGAPKVLSAEGNPTVRATMVEPDFTDTSFAVGSLAMNRGRAFIINNGQPPSQPLALGRGAPVAKRIQVIAGKTYLIESVEHAAIQADLDTLPAPDQAALKVPDAAAHVAYADRAEALRSQPLRQQQSNPTAKIKRTAALQTPAGAPKLAGLGEPPKTPVFSVDYDLSGWIWDLTPKGDTTYLVAGEVDLFGVTTIERNTGQISDPASGGRHLFLGLVAPGWDHLPD